MPSENATCFILIDDASETSNQVVPEDFETFSKTFQNKEPEIIIVDSTEDESEKSLVKSQRPCKKIKKTKPNLKKIKLCKRKTVFKLEELQKSARKMELERQKSQDHETNETEENEALQRNDVKENEAPVDFQRILPLVQEKDIRLGSKYQCSMPKFQMINEKNSRLNEVLKNKVWDPCLIEEQEFADCKNLLQTILELNYFTDDYVCKFLTMHRYNVEDTINYCFTNRDKLQKEIIDSYIPNDPLFRKTRNSLYNKFLTRKL